MYGLLVFCSGPRVRCVLSSGVNDGDAKLQHFFGTAVDSARQLIDSISPTSSQQVVREQTHSAIEH